MADDDGVGIFQGVKFRSQAGLALGHIEDDGDAEDLPDVFGILGDEQSWWAGDWGDTAEFIQAEVAPESGGGFSGVEVLESEEV